MDEMDALQEELRHYKAEKEKIRDVVGQVGGKPSHQREWVINILFLIVVISAFLFDVLRHLLGWSISYLPPTLLLEMAVLMVSLKIIWMIHMQTKVNHFQFWILNSIEFQLNMLARRISDLDKTIQAHDNANSHISIGDESPSSGKDT